MTTHLALKIIRDEHAALAAMLRSLPRLLQGREPVPFDVIRAMLFYVDEFPERLHHPKETTLLFPRLRAACPALRPVLDQLDAEHEQGERAIRELEHALTGYELLGEARRADFEAALNRYVDGYLQHMALEESQVLPAAQRYLTAGDWAALDAAFSTHQDPMTGHEPSDLYRPLFRRIIDAAPAPIGFGPVVGEAQ